MSVEKMVGASARLRDDMDIFADHLVSEGLLTAFTIPWSMHGIFTGPTWRSQ